MKELLAKSVMQLREENASDEEMLRKNLTDFCDWIEKSADQFNALNYFSRAKVEEQIDSLVKRNNKSGRLYGIPIVIKDNISINNWPTTAASRILKGYESPYDATVIERLREAGAVFVARANMDEFAMGSSGENSADGFSRNPWDKNRVPGGSSSGSAISAAAGFGLGALGSDTGGSIRLPASFCGVIGVKPTYGRVSRFGLLALGSSLDQIGPLTRRVEDAALIMEVMAGLDKNDSTTEDVVVDDYSVDLDQFDCGCRIGLIQEMYEKADGKVKKVMDEMIDVLTKKGVRVEEVSMPVVKYSIPVYYLVQASECSANLARYDGIRFGFNANQEMSVDSLMEQYLKTRQHGLGDEVKRRIILGTYSLSSGYYDDYFKKAARVRTRIINEFNQLFADYDILIGMTSPTTAFKIGEKIDDPLSMYLTDIMTIGVSMAGLPAISVPIGFSENLPVGVQLIGPMWSEKRLFKLAYLLEKEYKWDEYVPTEIKSMLEE